MRVKIVEEAEARKNETRNTISNAMIARKYQEKRHNLYNKSDERISRNKEEFRYIVIAVEKSDTK